MKKCKQCLIEKELPEFYKLKGMKDGLTSKCKKCTAENSTKYRNANLEKVREYDRNRGNRQPDGYLKEWREKCPNKYKAHAMVNNAVRDGKLFKDDCSECGSDDNPHAHHDDYLKPLNIRWLCAACHHQWHAKHGEALNP